MTMFFNLILCSRPVYTHKESKTDQLTANPEHQREVTLKKNLGMG